MKITDYIQIKAVVDAETHASEYSETKTYEPGTYCIHDDKLYICVHETSGEWNPDDWIDATTSGQVVEEVEKTQDMISASFATNVTYHAGEYVVHNDKFYRFTADHTGGWTGTDVVEVSVGGVLADLQSVLEGHVTNTDIHVTVADKANWNEKLEVTYDSEKLVFSQNI